MMWRRLLPWFLPALWALPTCAADWQVLPEASRLEFSATYQGLPVPGVFRRFDVSMAFEPDHLAGSRLDVSVMVASADMSSADVNQTIKGPEWFDAGRFPEARFENAVIAQVGAGRYRATGTLTLKGVRREVTVPFSWSVAGDTASMKGQLTLRRTDFNIGTGEWASGGTIGLDVPLSFSLKLRRLK